MGLFDWIFDLFKPDPQPDPDDDLNPVTNRKEIAQRLFVLHKERNPEITRDPLLTKAAPRPCELDGS